MKFQSQICTSVEQSKRLLELGLKKETADMVWEKEIALDKIAHCPYYTGYYVLKPIGYLEGNWNKEDIPAWSLGRLLEVMRMKASSQVVPLDDTFDRLIEGIETRIKEGYFNTDYLEEKK